MGTFGATVQVTSNSKKQIVVVENLVRDLGFNQQALYCYTKLYSLDTENVDALWDRASLAREMRDLRTVRMSSSLLLARTHQRPCSLGSSFSPGNP
jgi:hypothetical protein